ncbi:mechanosensitive ion channel family protein [Aliiruegeria sabulilitoris]|uniref:mechanosensitive ion channel family protein n=1 Tax=Aliiruegeria sabulilitoris TaxID=1510458 RepID=UPI0012E34DBA|nr:mechanosensitive ion channel family protein [Aliiruegeria sabulilitoris]
MPIFGLFGILACSAFLIVRIATVYVSGRVHRVRASVELLAFLAIIYFLIGPVLNWLGDDDLAGALQRAVMSAAAVCIAFLLNGIIRTVLWDGLLSDHGQRQVPVIVTEGVGLAIYLTAIVLVMHFVYDEPIGGLLATSGVVALVLGFAAQSTLKEVFSGVALNATQALHIGDYVEIDGVYGQVYEINWRSISVKNPHTDSLYIFPNSGVADRTILNFSEPTERFKYYVRFIVELSAPPELVMRAIAHELEKSRYVRREPKPDFNMLGYTKEGIEIRIRYYFDGDDPWWDAQNEMIMAIWTAMRKHRLRISVNRHLLGSGDEWSELDQRQEVDFGVESVLGVLRRSKNFSGCSNKSLFELASTASVLSLNPPGRFFEPGAATDGLFLVLDGHVALYRKVPGRGDSEIKIEGCCAGDVFGLQSFIERTDRKLLAQAEQYSVVAHLSEDALRRLIDDHPELQAMLETDLSVRRAQREKDAEAAQRQFLATLYADERRKLSEDIRQNVDEMLERPALHHFLSLLSSKVRHEDVLTATMAGAAIVAACRGGSDQQEEAYLRRAMAEADLLRHMDLEHGLDLFRTYTSMDDVSAPDGEVFAMLDRASEMKGGPNIVQAVAVGMTGVHGEPTQKELQALRAISKRTGVEVPRWAREIKGQQDGE